MLATTVNPNFSPILFMQRREASEKLWLLSVCLSMWGCSIQTSEHAPSNFQHPPFIRPTSVASWNLGHVSRINFYNDRFLSNRIFLRPKSKQPTCSLCVKWPHKVPKIRHGVTFTSMMITWMNGPNNEGRTTWRTPIKC